MRHLETVSVEVVLSYLLPLSKKENPHGRLSQKANVNHALLPPHSHPHGYRSVWLLFGLGLGFETPSVTAGPL